MKSLVQFLSTLIVGATIGAVFSAAYHGIKARGEVQPPQAYPSKDYAKGFNDAIDSMTLISLEVYMGISTNRTWGEVGRIACERHGVKRIEH